ncbi:MAG: AAA family ATPase [Magnetococcales bacterium]|nr:AAA family ATPase [Magnetococcales bacterium]
MKKLYDIGPLPRFPLLISTLSPSAQTKCVSRPLPLALRQLEIRNFQCIRATGIDDLPPDAPWIFITGDNGDGKTSLLQALAIGLHGAEDADRLLKENPMAVIGVSLQSEDEKSPVVRNFARWSGKGWELLDQQGRSISPVDNLLAYGPARLDISDEESTASGKAAKSSVYSKNG